MQEYYNPFKEELKENRLELKNDYEVLGVRYLEYLLHTDDLSKYSCPKCNSNDFTKTGLRKRIIKRQLFLNKEIHISINIQRFKCLKCGSIFQDTSPIIPINSNIPIHTKVEVLIDLAKIVSFKDVANKYKLDEQTVINIFNDTYTPPKYKLPDTLCFDEKKNIDGPYGKYMFVMLDPINFKVIDILKTRESSYLKEYLYDIDINERNHVKYIIMDMYQPYKEIAKLLFPNATIVIDAFHFVRYMTNALSDIRVRIQDSYNENSKEYKILKSNWKLLLLDKNKVNFDYIKYNQVQSKKTNMAKILDDILNLNKELSDAYNLYQYFIRKLDLVHYEKAKEFMDEIIMKLRDSQSKEYNEVARTFIHWEKEIINSFIRFGDSRLSNGPVEGLNDLIDHIINVSFGYKIFETLRKRIIYCINKDIKITVKYVLNVGKKK